MYCIKVTPGSERIKVRQVASGFNPKYREAEANGKISDKRLAVPGYVFTMQFTPGAKKVPEAEWKIAGQGVGHDPGRGENLLAAGQQC